MPAFTPIGSPKSLRTSTLPTPASTSPFIVSTTLGTLTFNGPGSTLSFAQSNLPAGYAAGDLLLVIVGANDNGFNSAASLSFGATPTGYTQGPVPQIPGNLTGLAIYYRTATFTTADALTVTVNGESGGAGSGLDVLIVAVRNAGTPTFGTIQYSPNSTGNVHPAIGSAGNLLLVAATALNWTGTVIGSALNTIVGYNDLNTNGNYMYLGAQVQDAPATHQVQINAISNLSASIAIPYSTSQIIVGTATATGAGVATNSTTTVNSSARSVSASSTATTGQVNFATNPSLESGITGWTWQQQTNGAPATVSQGSTLPVDGQFTAVASITGTQTIATNHGMSINLATAAGTIVPGLAYTFSVYVKPSRTNVFLMGVDWVGAVASATATATSAPAGVWTRISASGTAPAGTTNINVNIWTNTAGGSVLWQNLDTITYDALLVEQSASLNAYPPATNLTQGTSGSTAIGAGSIPTATGSSVSGGSTGTATGAGAVTANAVTAATSVGVGAGVATSNTTVSATATSTGAGTVSSGSASNSAATLIGAGITTALATVTATAPATGAGSATANSTTIASSTATGAGVATSSSPRLIAPATATGAGTATANATTSATASATGAGSATANSGASATGTATATGAAVVTANPWPNASNTGVPVGTTLTASGNITATANQVIQNLDITGRVTIPAGATNVVIKNCKIHGDPYYGVLVQSGGNSVTIQDCEIYGAPGGSASISTAAADATGSSTLITRCNIYGYEDGVVLGNNTTLQDSWIHDLGSSSTSHSDAIQVQTGVVNSSILRNSLYSVIGSVGVTSAIFVAPDLGPSAVGPLTIQGNLISGGGFYSLRVVNGSSGLYHQTGISVTNNWFVNNALTAPVLVSEPTTAFTAWNLNQIFDTGAIIANPAPIQGTASATGAGSATANSGASATGTATATGAAVVTANATTIASNTATGAGVATSSGTIAATATAVGAATSTANSAGATSGTATVTGTSSTTANATTIASSTAKGAGVATAAATSTVAGTATATAAGTAAATSTITAPLSAAALSSATATPTLTSYSTSTGSSSTTATGVNTPAITPGTITPATITTATVLPIVVTSPTLTPVTVLTSTLTPV